MTPNFFNRKHSENTLGVIRAAFPARLGEDVATVRERIFPAEIEPHVDPSHAFLTYEGGVTIPGRVYFPELTFTAPNGLTDTQTALLAALMALHHSGLQRELSIRPLLAYPASWTVPFVAILLGDYVRQILQTLDCAFTPVWEPLMRDFAGKIPFGAARFPSES